MQKDDGTKSGGPAGHGEATAMAEQGNKGSIPELVTFSAPAFVYFPLPSATSYGHRAELWVSRLFSYEHLHMISKQSIDNTLLFRRVFATLLEFLTHGPDINRRHATRLIW